MMACDSCPFTTDDHTAAVCPTFRNTAIPTSHRHPQRVTYKDGMAATCDCLKRTVQCVAKRFSTAS
jgi:hypothetical protein